MTARELVFERIQPHGTHPNVMRVTYDCPDAYIRPPREAKEAFARISGIMATFDPADLALIKKFNGNPVLYHMTGLDNRIKESEAEATIALARDMTQKRYPNQRIIDAWVWGMGCDSGVSVLISSEITK